MVNEEQKIKFGLKQNKVVYIITFVALTLETTYVFYFYKVVY